jgi:hypothetical protein
MGNEIVVGLHFYQPPREASHPSLRQISTDPENKNWTEIIELECYKPLAEEGILNKASFDIYQSLLLQLEKIDPATAKIYQKSMRENGIGEAFIHPILPDLSTQDKQIVISAGSNRFREITGQSPKIFWPPETAIDTETLCVLAENGYEAFICAPEQIVQSDGSSSDNQPTQIALPTGQNIIAIPFDRSISSKLAFDGKTNADRFSDDFIKPKQDQKTGKTIVAWTDAETFGHHFKNGDKFLDYLLNSSLPSIGLYPVSINRYLDSMPQIKKGKIVERSAWSCSHGDLVRWNNSCDCSWGYDSSWKRPFTESLEKNNQEISEILQRHLGSNYPLKVSSQFYELYAHPERVNSPEKALIAAKISALIARTSCATFFATPNVSGKINLLYAYQSILYLSDSGLTSSANVLKDKLFKDLSKINYPGNQETALSTLLKMISL